jgi:hypothetical protein
VAGAVSAAGSAYLDFLGVALFRYDNLRFWRLDFLGFPWILSSETSLFNGLHGIFCEEKFEAFCPLELEAAERIATILAWGRQGLFIERA